MGKGQDEFIADDDEEEEVEEEEEEEGDEEEAPRKRSRASQFIDDIADEDDEEEDEEDEGGGGRKKAKKSGGGYRSSAYIDDVAAVASEDEEEEEEGEDDFIDQENDIGEEPNRPSVHHRNLLPRDVEEEGDVDAFERQLEERYGAAAEATVDELETTEAEQQALLPSVDDPKLWRVKCQIGQEREAAATLMQKFMNLHLEGKEQMSIIAAVAVDSIKGSFYIEARREAQVREACAGIRLIYAGSKPMLVPIKEMPSVLTVRQNATELDVAQWVRVKSGVFKGDIAQVLEWDSVRQKCLIKILPRIDFQALAQKQNGETVAKKHIKPPARFFNVEEAESKGIKVSERRTGVFGEMMYYVDGNMGFQFNREGYQLKYVSIKSLETRNVVPTLDELQQFQRASDEEGRGVGLSPALANKQRGRLTKGDTVEITEGDLRGIKGRVEKVEGDEVVLRPSHAELKEAIVVKEQQLRKYFNLGDHVKVIAGVHKGETGMIVKLEGHVATLVSDATTEHVKVFARDLISSSEVTTAPSQLGEYELHDLVLLDQTMCGLIIKVEASGCVVLKGIPDRADAAPVKLLEIRRKLTNKNVSAQDCDGREINQKDPVRVVDGVYRGKQGIVEHIYRGLLFVFDRNHSDSGGFFCARARGCRAFKGGARGPIQQANQDRNRSVHNGLLQSPSHFMGSPRHVLASPQRGYGRGMQGQGSYGGGRHGHRRDDVLIGRTVKIRTGPYKGYKGKVLEATDTNARIELESAMRIITVRRDQLPDWAGAAGGGPPQAGPTPYRDSPFFRNTAGSETPVHPSRTPVHPGYGRERSADPTATPIHEGMRTPMRDPAWNPSVPTTPLRSSNYDAFNPSTFRASSAAPAYEPYTPAFSPAPNAPTPADTLDPDTPGSRAYDVPTPGSTAPSNYNPTTPYGEPSTPYDAPTPSNLPSTPGAAPSPYPSAGSPYVPPTPGDTLPMTPGDPSSPATFGAPSAASDSTYLLPGILVDVPRPGAPSDTITVVIREILPNGSCRVGVRDAPEDELFVVAPNNVEPLVPKKNDFVKILKGQQRGLTGKLVGIDAGEGIVKLGEDAEEIVILELSSLGKRAN